MDYNIEDFFAEMRKQDDQVSVPDVDSIYKKKPHWVKAHIIPLGIAASLLLIVSLYFGMDKRTDIADSQEVVIIISGNGEMNTQSLLEYESNIDSWESPSAFLIDDF